MNDLKTITINGVTYDVTPGSHGESRENPHEVTAEQVGAVPADQMKKTFFTIPKNETAIINFSGTTNAMIYCRGWAGNLSSVINYTGYAGGSSRQSLDVLASGGQVYCGLLPESMGQGLAIRNVSSTSSLDVCIDGELQNNPPTITFTTEAIDGLSNAETFTRVGHTHTEYAPSGYGLGTTGKQTSDWNATMLSGFYYGKTNSPDGGWWAGVVYAEGAGYAFQHLYKNSSTAQKVRECNNGTWGAWVDVSPSAFAPATHTHTASDVGAVPCGSVVVGVGQSAKIATASNFIAICRLSTAAGTTGVYAVSAYSEYRAPNIAQLAVGASVSVSTGGSNDTGWYTEIANTASGGNVVVTIYGGFSIV